MSLTCFWLTVINLTNSRAMLSLFSNKYRARCVLAAFCASYCYFNDFKVTGDLKL